ncbi:flavin reductase family protein [Microbacterium sp. NPDC058062]|uniref:flavin reductase family protein n=1 Tax=Microbacterium sp. NPDC058062 TaxID=3346320 RepID=UPI0036D83CA5
MVRDEFTGELLAARGDALVHRLVIPRPVAWVSTRSASGADNLAPHSFFTVVSTRPSILMISSIGFKDTARNVIETGEFVVNVSSEANVESINLTATEYPPELSEFDEVGVRRLRSILVNAPSVAESAAAMECRLVRHEEIGNGFLLFGEVVAITVDPAVCGDRGPESGLLRPVARLGGIEWTTLGTVTRRKRMPFAPRN